METNISVLENKAHNYRRRFLELFTRIGFGHVTSAFSWTEIATVLCNYSMKLPRYYGERGVFDKIFVSKGHGAGMLFPIFEDLGYFTKEELDAAVSIGGETEKLRSLYYPGFDFYGGSLGIGLGLAAGSAMSDKLDHRERTTYCIVGDAECYEGSIWEAINFSSHNKLNNLVVIVDRNGLGASDFTENMLSFEPLKRKWESFNWDVYEVDGHDIKCLIDVFDTIKKSDNKKPKCIIAITKKGKGLDYLIDKPLMHGYMPQGKEIKIAFENLR